MTTYRSKQTISAVQFIGDPIEGVTCLGSSPDKDIAEKARQANGCDSSRAHMPHVHTKDVGGMKVLTHGMWVFAEPAGPWGTKSDAGFRAFWEVPNEVVAAPVPVKCQHCGADTLPGVEHQCPQMQALNMERWGGSVTEVPVAVPTTEVPGTETVTQPDSNELHIEIPGTEAVSIDAPAPAPQTIQIPGTETVTHPAVDGQNPTETEADLHN